MGADRGRHGQANGKQARAEHDRPPMSDVHDYRTIQALRPKMRYRGLNDGACVAFAAPTRGPGRGCMRFLLTTSTIVAIISTTMLGQTEKVYSPGDGVSLPVVAKRVNPEYTSEARQQQIEGVVTLTSVVRRDGHVTDVKVKQSLDSVYGLDQKAIEALRQWEFKPGMKDNEPVAVQIDVQMKFTLK